ncbi:MAG: hypothetical protein ACMXYK_00540, partial [Candidatus Woesearchaeota archaeon]
SKSDREIILSTKKRISHGDLNVYLERICFDISKNNCGRVNDQTKRVEPSFRLRAEFQKPNIEVKRSYSTNNAFLGEEITVTVEVRNKGDVEVRDFKYSETYPSSVDIAFSNVINRLGNTVEYTRPRIRPDESFSFSYKISLKELIEYSLRGSYSYTYREEVFSFSTANSILRIKNILDLSMTLDTNSIEPQGQAELRVDIRNLADGQTSYDLVVNIPVEVVSSGDFIEIAGRPGFYRVTGNVAKGDTVTKRLRVRPTQEGTHTFTAELDSHYIIPNPTKFASTTLSVGYGAAGDLSVRLIPKHNAILETEESYVEVHLVKGTNAVITNIDFNVTASPDPDNAIGVQNFRIPEIEGTFENRYVRFTLPRLNTTNIRFTLSGTYIKRHFNGTLEQKTLSESVTIQAYAIEDAFTITHNLAPSTINQGDTARVILTIENKLDRRGFQGIFAKDTVPEDFIHRPIVTEMFFHIEPRERKQVYSYEIRAPFFVDPTKSDIVSVIEFEDFNITRRSDVLVRGVQLDKPDLSVVANFPTAGTVGSIVRANFRIRNTGDTTINDIQVHFPLDAHIELMNSEVMHIEPSLDVGEEINLFKDYRIVSAGNIDLDRLEVVFKDIYGNQFSSLSNTQNVVFEPGSRGCGIISQKIILQESIPADVSITFRNTCEDAILVNTNRGNVEIAGQSQRDISFSQLPRNDTIEGTRFSYTHNGNRYVGLTESYVIVTEMALAEGGDIEGSPEDVRTDSSSEPISENSESSSVTLSNPNSSRTFREINPTIVVIILLSTVFLFVLSIGHKGYQKNKLKKSFADSDGAIANKDIAFFKAHEKDVTTKDHVDKKSTGDSASHKFPHITQPQAPSVGTNISALVTYIDTAKTAGIPIETITQNLQEKGWDESIIRGFL